MSVSTQVSRDRPRWGVLIVGLGGLLAIAISATFVSPAGFLGLADEFLNFIRNLGFWGAVAFGIVQLLVAVSGILPLSLLGISAGFIFGLLPGFGLSAGSTMMGAALAFFLSRSLLRPTVERVLARKSRFLQQLDTSIGNDSWRMVALVRVSPVMPFSITSYALGMTSIPLLSYILGTLASLPALFGYVVVGTLADASLSTAMTSGGTLRWGLLGVGALATLGLVFRMGQLVKKVSSARNLK